jgi:hypothetical protein
MSRFDWNLRNKISSSLCLVLNQRHTSTLSFITPVLISGPLVSSAIAVGLPGYTINSILDSTFFFIESISIYLLVVLWRVLSMTD